MTSSPEHDVRAAAWRKSAHSGGDGGNCVEVAVGLLGIVPVRDSKDAHGPVLLFGSAAWSAFLAGVMDGRPVS
jgi:hypothetical protein